MKSEKCYISQRVSADCLVVSRGWRMALAALFWRFKPVFLSLLSSMWNVSHLPILSSDSLAKPLSEQVSKH